MTDPRNIFDEMSDEEKNQSMLHMMQMLEKIDDLNEIINRVDGLPLKELTPELWGQLQNLLPVAQASATILKAASALMVPVMHGEEIDQEAFHEAHGKNIMDSTRKFLD